MFALSDVHTEEHSGSGHRALTHKLVLSSRKLLRQLLDGTKHLNHFTNQPPIGACPPKRSQAPNYGGWQHPLGHLSDRGTEPCPPRRATSPDTDTSEPPNKVKGGGIRVADVLSGPVLRLSRAGRPVIIFRQPHMWPKPGWMT